MFSEQLISVGPLALNMATGAASGSPLLFLHGVTRCWQDFATLLPTVSIRRQCHALDLRGHGRSDRGERYRVVDYVTDVVNLLRFHFQEPVTIYGHSLGALTAIGVAARVPECVQAIILEDPPGEELLRNMKDTPFHAFFTGMQPLAGKKANVKQLAAELADLPLPASGGKTVRLGDLRDATSIRFGARCLQDLDPHVLKPLIHGGWLTDFDISENLRAVRCPSLLLKADELAGGMLSRTEADRMASLLHDALVIDFPGTGHLIHWLQAEKTARFVVGFLESLR